MPKHHHRRHLDVEVHYVARPELGYDTPAIIILSFPRRPDRAAYQGYAYLASQDDRLHWVPAGDEHDNPDDCLAAAIAHARVLRDQDPPVLPHRHHPAVAGLLVLAYELASNGPQERAQ